MTQGVMYGRGDLILVDIEPLRGSEEGMKRPCVVLSDLTNVRASGSRPLYFVFPLTTSHQLRDPLAPLLKQSAQGLRADSVALVMYARSITPERILARWGQVSPQDVATLQAAMAVLVGQ